MEDFYKDISKDGKRLFDTSNYPKDHLPKIPTEKNKKVIWDVLKTRPEGRFSGICGTESKAVCLQDAGQKEREEVQGIRKPVIKKDISFEDYKRCVFMGSEQM